MLPGVCVPSTGCCCTAPQIEAPICIRRTTTHQRQHCWWTKRNIFGKDFFLFFIKFHCPQLFYCTPCPAAAPPALLLLPCPIAAPLLYHWSPCPTAAPPAAAPRSLNVQVVTTIFAKTLVCKCEYDVILWRHKQRISSNNDHHTQLLNTRIWWGGIQPSSRPGHHQTLHATAYWAE